MLIRSVETFLRRHAMSPTMFGREAAQDARLVTDMRNGREPRSPLDQRLRGFMEGFDFARSQSAAPADFRPAPSRTADSRPADPCPADPCQETPDAR